MLQCVKLIIQNRGMRSNFKCRLPTVDIQHLLVRLSHEDWLVSSLLTRLLYEALCRCHHVLMDHGEATVNAKTSEHENMILNLRAETFIPRSPGVSPMPSK